MSADYSAWHFDGRSATRRSVTVELIGSQFFLVETEMRHGPFALADLSYVGDQGQSAVYGLEGQDGWRLGIVGTVPADLKAVLPRKQKYGQFIDKVGLGPASIAFASVSAAVLAIALWAPHWVAPLIPYSAEKKIGDTMIGDFGGRFCHTKAGSAALAKLTASLDDHPADLQVDVAKIDVLNAVALPGHRVILFQGLVDQAASPDEVAGVLAHEIGHVREHHVMQGMLRQLGLSVVLGGLDGTGGATFNSLMSVQYGREAESEADSHSVAMLKRANISPLPTAQFFDRLSGMDGSKQVKGNAAVVVNYTSSHPLSVKRKEQFERSAVKNGNYRPALTPEEWTSLKTMCSQDKKAKSGFGFDID